MKEGACLWLPGLVEKPSHCEPISANSLPKARPEAGQAHRAWIQGFMETPRGGRLHPALPLIMGLDHHFLSSRTPRPLVPHPFCPGLTLISTTGSGSPGVSLPLSVPPPSRPAEGLSETYWPCPPTLTPGLAPCPLWSRSAASPAPSHLSDSPRTGVPNPGAVDQYRSAAC